MVVKIRLSILVVVAMALSGCSAEADRVRIESPWILEAPGGTDNMAGYGVLRNSSSDAVVIESVDSPAFEDVHLHETSIEDGQARMAPVDSLTLPAGGRAVMRPGGLHLMLMSPVRMLERGDSARIRFHLSDGATLTAEFVVRSAPPERQ
jgi:copper(I)-binding protein